MRLQVQHSICFSRYPLHLACPPTYFTASRTIHTTRPDHASLAATSASQARSVSSPTSPVARRHSKSPLGVLPFSQIIRTYVITTVSSSAYLLDICSALLRRLLESKSVLTNVDRNPILRAILRQTFYKQFCSGSTRAEVQATIQGLQKCGYEGVILEYALEVLKGEAGDEKVDIEKWRKGMLDTISMANTGDFVGLKWSGLGSSALSLLQQNKPPSRAMDTVMREVCSAAAEKGISLLPAAEETATLDGFYSWTLPLQRDYNTSPESRPVVFCTYQAYLRSTPATLAKHLWIAQREGFTFGIKLVRGAYLSSEHRHLLQPGIEATHAAYDSITSSLLKRQYELGGALQPLHGGDSKAWPNLAVVLATHNAVSVRKAQALRAQQVSQKEPLVPLAYAQLQGMADEVSCEILSARNPIPQQHTQPEEHAGQVVDMEKTAIDVPKTYKCTTWGTTSECLNYLLRRAAENKDAATRTKESRVAMAQEIRRRINAAFGLA
ncbi:hypothetical protein LTR28_013155 [Elasticomyces elasticus]|nr:hypothetical protein LTR28_013155 [Elasticomyces elasticus]